MWRTSKQATANRQANSPYSSTSSASRPSSASSQLSRFREGSTWRRQRPMHCWSVRPGRLRGSRVWDWMKLVGFRSALNRAMNGVPGGWRPGKRAGRVGGCTRRGWALEGAEAAALLGRAPTRLRRPRAPSRRLQSAAGRPAGRQPASQAPLSPLTARPDGPGPPTHRRAISAQLFPHFLTSAASFLSSSLVHFSLQGGRRGLGGRQRVGACWCGAAGGSAAGGAGCQGRGDALPTHPDLTKIGKKETLPPPRTFRLPGPCAPRRLPAHCRREPTPFLHPRWRKFAGCLEAAPIGGPERACTC